MKELKNSATYFLAASLFSLAGSILYFSVQIANIVTEMPDLLVSINQTNENIEPVINEVTEIRKQIPAILKEVSETRKQIPLILDEVKSVREQIPPILEEVKETRALVPGVLAEVKATRKAIPPMLDQGSRIVKDARTVTEKAGQGAVTGFFKGIVMAPYRLISGMGKTLFSVSGKTVEKLSEEDLKQLDQISSEILASETIGEEREWENEEQDLTGKLVLISIDLNEDSTCKKLKINLWHNDESILEKTSTLCLDKKGNWTEKK